MKRRQLVILGHGRWLDEKTEQSGDNIKYRVKSAIIIIMIIIIIITITIEGTVCAPDIILTREAEKQQKCGEMRNSLEKMYPEHDVDQFNIVFDFLACYSKQLYTKMENLIGNSKTTTLILEQSQKWVMSQNCEIVRHFYTAK